MIKPKEEEMEGEVQRSAEWSGPIPATLQRRLKGEDLENPADILRVAIVLAMDLESVLLKSDEQAVTHGLKKVCPGLARPDGRSGFGVTIA